MPGQPSDTKEKVLQYYLRYLDEHGYPPPDRDIAEAVGLKSHTNIQRYLKQLREEGRIPAQVSTPREVAKSEAYKICRQFKKEHGCLPSGMELGKAMGIHQSTASRYLNELEEEGLISQRDHKSEIFQFYCEYQKENGHPPSLKEIGAAVGIDVDSTISYHLKQLEKEGLIEGLVAFAKREKKSKIAVYCHQYEKEHGKFPSQRKIAEAVGVTRPAIGRYLDELAEEGRIPKAKCRSASLPQDTLDEEG